MTLPEAERHLSLAVEAVVSRFGAMVRQVGRRYRLDEADVDEVMQEVRIRLWRAQGTSEQIGEVNTSYVYRTASSAALDVIRRRRSRRAEHHQSLDDESSAVALAEPTPGPHGRARGLGGSRRRWRRPSRRSPPPGGRSSGCTSPAIRGRRSPS